MDAQVMTRMRINVSLDPDTIEDLKRMATEQRSNVSAVIERLVLDARAATQARMSPVDEQELFERAWRAYKRACEREGASAPFASAYSSGLEANGKYTLRNAQAEALARFKYNAALNKLTMIKD